MSRRPLPHRRVRHITCSALAASLATYVGACASAHAGDAPARESTERRDAAPPPPAERLLDQLEAAAADHRTLTARVRMRSIQDLLDDETTRFGDLAWARTDPDANTPTRFAVAFDRLQSLDGPLEAIDRRYVYDGHWLLDADGRARTATRRELHPAGPGGAANFGDGPFLIPLNLRKDRVLERFAVTLAAPDTDADPQGPATDHLVLIPHPDAALDASRIDLWFDRLTRLPRRAASQQADGDRTVVDLFEVQLNTDMPSNRFDTTLPGTPGWELQTVPATDR